MTGEVRNSLNSSVEDKGKVVSQVIHFTDGSKKTFHGILAESIEQSEFTRFDLEDGRRIYINTANVNCFEVIKSFSPKLVSTRV